jgi:predicted RNA-binding Zn-ribbon protein involved in translation (DUF1610 family)
MAMIKFPCKSCGQKLSVDEKHAGKRVKCPKCGSVGVVPDSSDKIKFHCDSCGQCISVPQVYAGKKGKCPKCKTPIVVPSDDRERADSAASGPSIPSGTDEYSYEDEEPYEEESDLPEESKGVDRKIIFAICGAAAVVVVGIIILVTTILPSGSEPPEAPGSLPQQEIADAGPQSDPVFPDTRQTGTSTPQASKEDTAPKASELSTAAASNDAGKFDLKLRLKPGQKYNVRITRADSSLGRSRSGQVRISHTDTTGLMFEVEQVDANDVARLKVTFLTIHEIAKSDRGQTEYDSTKPDTAAGYPSGPEYSAMIGQSFVTKVAPRARKLEFEGLDETFLRVAEKVIDTRDEANRKRMAKAMTRKISEGVRRSMERAEAERRETRNNRVEVKRKSIERNYRFGREHISEMVRDVIMPFPDGPVGIGDSWQTPTRLTFMRAIDLDDTTYTLRENSPAGALVDLHLKVDMNNKPTLAADGRPDSSTATLTGFYEGSIEIDPTTGWMPHKKVTLRCSGQMNLAPTERNPQGMTVPISVEHVVTVEPIEVE